jgi:hypothetical protein
MNKMMTSEKRLVIYGLVSLSAGFLLFMAGLYMTGAFYISIIVSMFGIALLVLAGLRVIGNHPSNKILSQAGAGQETLLVDAKSQDVLALSHRWKRFKQIYWMSFTVLFIILVIYSYFKADSGSWFPYIPIVAEGVALLSYLIPALILYFIIKYFASSIVKRRANKKINIWKLVVISIIVLIFIVMPAVLILESVVAQKLYSIEYNQCVKKADEAYGKQDSLIQEVDKKARNKMQSDCTDRAYKKYDKYM